MKALAASIFAVLCTTSAFAASEAPTSPACAAKRASIEAEIAEAKANSNRRKLPGLEMALAANKRNCTDASLEAARKKDIASASQKVKRREADLAAAQKKGDQKKIDKQQQKLDEARDALTKAEQPLLQ